MKVFPAFLPLLMYPFCQAFVPHGTVNRSPIVRSPFANTFGERFERPSALERQRRSVGTVQTMGLFGLGFPEIAVIVIAIGFVLGPQKLMELLKSSAARAGEITDELKAVPEEFKKGMEEGEMNAKARNAKPMELGESEKEDVASTQK